VRDRKKFRISAGEGPGARKGNSIVREGKKVIDLNSKIQEICHQSLQKRGGKRKTSERGKATFLGRNAILYIHFKGDPPLSSSFK